MQASLVLKRSLVFPSFVPGRIILDGSEICQSLENPAFRLIPAGTYGLSKHVSPTLKYHILYIHAPKPFNHHELHRGNTVSDSRGCPLVGYRFAFNTSALFYSQEALDLLVSLYVRGVFSTLTIID